MSAEFEAAVMRDLLAQARRCARLEMALEDVRKKLEGIQWDLVPGSHTDDLSRIAIARIDAALEDKT